MLLRGTTRQRLKPVGVVGSAQIHGPLFHTDSHTISDVTTQGLLIVHQLKQLVQNVTSDILLHFLASKDVLSKDHACTSGLVFCYYGLMVKSHFDCFKANVVACHFMIVFDFNRVVFCFMPQNYDIFLIYARFFAKIFGKSGFLLPGNNMPLLTCPKSLDKTRRKPICKLHFTIFRLTSKKTPKLLA